MVLSAFNEAIPDRGTMRISTAEMSITPTWSPPPLGVFKVNVDGSCHGVDKSGHIGVDIRDSTCRCLAVCRKQICAASVLIAEALGILEGCMTNLRWGYEDVVVESDSRNLISWLNGNIEQGNWEVFPILLEFCGAARAFRSCSWAWVPRT
ncbi:uncharacterized protein [Pyrus communis]|uniref:uncharacterized protein n=1 Tax=Pyrus communis TaxID=23211 RepID=UPI0035BEE639